MTTKTETERINIYDRDGSWLGWYNKRSADGYEEGGRWDGRNWISRATGLQFEHEKLVRTASKKNILLHWSDWQGSTEWEEILTDSEAAEWLAKNEYESVDDLLLDKELQDILKEKEQ